MNSKLVKNFLEGYSIEVTPNAAAKIENFAEVLPANTRIYIAHIEGTPFEEMLNTAKKITNEGFIPMPHFPARIIEDKDMLESWLSQYSEEADVQEALLIAGGSKKPAGVFDSSIQIIETELFDKYNFKRLHVAGHPEGNKDIDKDNSHTNVNKAYPGRMNMLKGLMHR